MRRVTTILLLLLALAGLVLVGFDATAEKGGKPPCFGLKATNPDHRGNIEGTRGDDVLVGDEGSNNFDTGGGGVDRVCGRGGDDFIGGASGARLLANGGDGGDIRLGTSADDLLLGGPGDDQLFGLRGPDSLDGGTGADKCDPDFRDSGEPAVPC